MLSWKYHIILFLTLLFACALTVRRIPADHTTEWVKSYYTKETQAFTAATIRLRLAISNMSGNKAGEIAKARTALKDCRLQYKRISFLLDYYFESEARSFNAPAKLEVEEPFIEYREPQGLQQMEALLWKPKPDIAALMQEARLLENSARDLYALIYKFETNADELVECMELEWIRVMILYPTGYDAAYLQSGIEEASVSVSAMLHLLQGLEENSGKNADSLKSILQSASAYLQQHSDFDGFDRLQFIVQYGLPVQSLLAGIAPAKALPNDNVHSTKFKNIRNLFSPDALDPGLFPGGSTSTDSNLVKLGERLFFSTLLSGNLTRSCSSCHNPSLYFQDGLERNRSLTGNKPLPRNSMGLLYCSLQYAQFWDGRAKRLEDQILEVFHNPNELAGNDSVVAERIRRDEDLSACFLKLREADKQAVNSSNIAGAIAAYLRTLRPFHSDFDRYISGDRLAMSKEQKKGFNLFMGKAGCGTCHFAPVFNGLTPPYYDRTEYEVLGTGGLDSNQHPVQDTDHGRYNLFPTPFYDGAFKTPTLRNAAKTAPYMHNGAYKTLDSVMEFYNRGGGIHSGLNAPNQTLSDRPLNLTKQEKKEIILFIEALTDKPSKGNPYKML